MARLVPSEFDWNWYHQMENSNDDQPPAYATNNSHVNPNSTAIEEKKGKYTRNRPPALHLRSIETADQRVPTLPQNYEAPTLPGRRLYSSTATFLKKLNSVYPHSSAPLHNSSPWPGSYPSPYDWPHAPSAPPRLQVPDGGFGQYSSHPSAHAQQTPVLTPRSSINFATSVNHLFNKFKAERQIPQWPWIRKYIIYLI